MTKPSDDHEVGSDLVSELDPTVLLAAQARIVPEVEELFAPPPKKELVVIPKHRVVSAYVLTAFEKGEFRRKDVVDRLYQGGASRGAANKSINIHIGSHADFYTRAQQIAGNINWDALTKPTRPKKAKTVFQARPVSEEARQSAREEWFKTDAKFAGRQSLSEIISDDDLIELQHMLIKDLDFDHLAAALLPLAETAFAEQEPEQHFIDYDGKRRHKHKVALASRVSVKVCGGNKLPTGDEERVVFNILMLLGSVGVSPEALALAGLEHSSKTLKSLQSQVNRDSHFAVSQQRNRSIKVFNIDSRFVRLTDRRQPDEDN